MKVFTCKFSDEFPFSRHSVDISIIPISHAYWQEAGTKPTTSIFTGGSHLFIYLLMMLLRERERSSKRARERERERDREREKVRRMEENISRRGGSNRDIYQNKINGFVTNSLHGHSTKTAVSISLTLIVRKL